MIKSEDFTTNLRSALVLALLPGERITTTTLLGDHHLWTTRRTAEREGTDSPQRPQRKTPRRKLSVGESVSVPPNGPGAGPAHPAQVSPARFLGSRPVVSTSSRMAQVSSVVPMHFSAVKNQNSALPGVRGNGMTSRMLLIPVT